MQVFDQHSLTTIHIGVCGLLIRSVVGVWVQPLSSVTNLFLAPLKHCWRSTKHSFVVSDDSCGVQIFTIRPKSPVRHLVAVHLTKLRSARFAAFSTVHSRALC